MFDNKKILLASKSPRRKELLRYIAPDCELIDPGDIEEIYPDDLPAENIPEYLSRLKASALKDRVGDNEIVVTADTIVINDGKVLGKPHNADQATEMLKSLSGNTHIVVTGVTLTSAEKSVTFSENTEVTFDTLCDEEIANYVEKYRPYDKAGAYGIQEWIGYIGISGIKGCYYNVMGLPVHSLYHELKNF